MTIEKWFVSLGQASSKDYGEPKTVDVVDNETTKHLEISHCFNNFGIKFREIDFSINCKNLSTR